MKTLFALALFAVITTPTLLSQPWVSETPALTTDGLEFAPPEQMPPGRLVTETEISKLAGVGAPREVLYLIGQFKVTAAGVGRTVMRSEGKAGRFRVVVEYPPSIPTPAEGQKLVRKSRGFLITEIRHGQDGQLTVYVREMMRPLTASSDIAPRAELVRC